MTKLLSQSEFNSLCANYDNLVLDYEQLRRENEKMELKLREKNDLDEFETLERKAKQDQENELSSKVELLREKEDQIKKLQEYIESQKSESMKMDLSYSSVKVRFILSCHHFDICSCTIIIIANTYTELLCAEHCSSCFKYSILVNPVREAH